METSVESGDRLRVNVSLMQAATDAEIGSKTLERPRGELFALQDDLSQEVSDFLRQQLGKEVQVRETRATTRNVEAWALYQRGRGRGAATPTRSRPPGDTAGAVAASSSAPTLLLRRRKRRIRPGRRRASCEAGSTTGSRGCFESADPDYHETAIRTGLEHAGRALWL